MDKIDHEHFFFKKRKTQKFAKAPESPQPIDHEFLSHVLTNKCIIIYMVEINQISKNKRRESYFSPYITRRTIMGYYFENFKSIVVIVKSSSKTTNYSYSILILVRQRKKKSNKMG